jgi:hypothetical protein
MSRFSPSVFRCFGAAIIEASMIWLLIARNPADASAASKRSNTTSIAGLPAILALSNHKTAKTARFLEVSMFPHATKITAQTHDTILDPRSGVICGFPRVKHRVTIFRRLRL